MFKFIIGDGIYQIHIENPEDIIVFDGEDKMDLQNLLEGGEILTGKKIIHYYNSM